MALGAKKLGDLVISLKGDTKQFNKSMSGAEKGVGSLKKAVIGLGLGFAAMKAVGTVTRLLKSSIAEAGNAELQMNKLRAMVGTVGEFYGHTAAEIERGTQALIKQSQALQTTTGYSDDLIQSAQAMLTTFQLTPDQVAQITPRLLDMAAASEKNTGAAVDLQAMAIALGKGFTGMQGQLARYGVILSEETKKTGNFNDIIKDLDLNFKGASKAIGETYVGQMRVASAAITDMREEIGARLLPVIADVVPHIVRLAEGIGAMVKRIEDGQGTIAFLADTVKGLTDMFWLMTNSVERNEQETQEYVNSLRKLKENLTWVMEKQGEATDGLTASVIMRVKERMELEKTIGPYKAYQLVMKEVAEGQKGVTSAVGEFITWKERAKQLEAENTSELHKLTKAMFDMSGATKMVNADLKQVDVVAPKVGEQMAEIGALCSLSASQVLNLAHSFDNLFSMFSEEGGFSLSRFLKALSGILMMIPGGQGLGAGLGLAGVGAGMFGMKSGGLLIPAAQGIMVDRPTPILAGEGGQTEIVSPIDKFFDLVKGLQPNIVVKTGDPSTYVEFVEGLSAGNKDRLWRGSMRGAQARDLAR